MKFPTKNGITTIRDDQMSARECYLNFPRKAEPRYANVILVHIDMNDTPVGMPVFFQSQPSLPQG